MLKIVAILLLMGGFLVCIFVFPALLTSGSTTAQYDDLGRLVEAPQKPCPGNKTYSRLCPGAPGDLNACETRGLLKRVWCI